MLMTPVEDTGIKKNQDVPSRQRDARWREHTIVAHHLDWCRAAKQRNSELSIVLFDANLDNLTTSIPNDVSPICHANITIVYLFHISRYVTEFGF